MVGQNMFYFVFVLEYLNHFKVTNEIHDSSRTILTKLESFRRVSQPEGHTEQIS